MRAWKFGADINTDEIIPARFLNTSDPKELAKYLMEDTNNESFKSFYKQGESSVKGDVFVADKNFGCGSSREHAPIAIKVAGIQYVIAESFARIFYRNAFNIGLIAIECPKVNNISQQDNIEVLLDDGIIKNISKNEQYNFNPVAPFMQQLINEGGLMAYRAKQKGYQKK